MSCAHSVARSCAQPAARAVNARWGEGYPAGLALLWPLKLSDAGVLKSAKGPAPTFSDTPTVTADGVTPGDGPSFTSAVTWTDGGTRVMRFTADTASADITDPVEIGGGFWATSTGLEFRDGTNVASVATSWESGEVVTGVVQVTPGGAMYVARDEVTYISRCVDLVDTIGANTRRLFPLRYLETASNVDLINAALTSGVTTTSKQGTASLTFASGKVTMGAGTLWSFTLSNGSQYEFGIPLSLTTCIIYDVSGNGRHLTSTVADAFAFCKTSMSIGSDYLNQFGYSERQNLLKNSDNLQVSPWTASNGAAITSANTLSLAAQSNSQLTTFTTGRIYLRAGETIRFSAKISNFVSTLNRLAIGVVETISPYASTYRPLYVTDSGLIEVRHTATVNGDVRLYIGNTSAVAATLTVDELTAQILPQDYADLVSFGDSICWASVEVETTYDEAASYTERFAYERNIPFRKYGVSGETLEEIAARFESQLGNPGSVFIEGGLNTITQAESTPIASMQAAMSGMVSAARAKTDNIVIFDCPAFGLSESDPREAWRLEWNAWLAGYCASEGILLVPMSTILDNPAYYSVADNWHPNKIGHAAVADYLADNFVYVGDEINRLVTGATAVRGPEPAVANSSALDCLGNALQYSGRAKYNIEQVSGDSGWNDNGTYKIAAAPELFAKIGELGGLFDSAGTPQQKTRAQILAVGGDRVSTGGQAPFDSMPPLALASTAPGSLLEVQEWKKANVTKKQIDKVRR